MGAVALSKQGGAIVELHEGACVKRIVTAIKHGRLLVDEVHVRVVEGHV